MACSSRPNSNRRLSLFDIARAIDDLPSLPDDLRGPLAAEATFTGRIPAYPTGAAVCEAEIDPETGMIEIRRYTSIDDGGQPINPLILHGQVHGGVAQGVGQAMMEAAVYEPGSGQLLSASFMDYGMPRADHFPQDFAIELTEDPNQGQRAARQGRRRGRHHAELGSADQRGAGRAVGHRHRAHRHAGDAAAAVGGD